MARFRSPLQDNPLLDIPFNLMEASDAAAKIISLQKDLFVLNQEIKTLRQIKRSLYLIASLICLVTLLILTFYWIGEGLHENGFSPFTLALLSALFFGLLIGVFLSLARQKPSQKTNKRTE